MDAMKAIRERKSYRGIFLDTPVPREDLREIVEAGFLAPAQGLCLMEVIY